MTDEQWRPVVGYEYLYEVSDCGRVRSIDRWVKSSRSNTLYLRKGRIRAQCLCERYATVSLGKGTAKKTHRVHRLVLEAFVGPCPDGHYARHLDGQSQHNVLSNLAWGTPTENSHDRISHNTVNRGTRNGHAKLTDQDAAILKRCGGLFSTKKWAEAMEVNTATIGQVFNGKTWRHVE